MMHHGPQSVKKMPIFRSTLLNLCYRVPLETNLGIFQKKCMLLTFSQFPRVSIDFC